MNPDGQMRLADSVKLYGLCQEMCPEYERVRRIVELDVKAPECVSSVLADMISLANMLRHPKPNIFPHATSAKQMSRAWSRHTHVRRQAWT